MEVQLHQPCKRPLLLSWAPCQIDWTTLLDPIPSVIMPNGEAISRYVKIDMIDEDNQEQRGE